MAIVKIATKDMLKLVFRRYNSQRIVVTTLMQGHFVRRRTINEARYDEMLKEMEPYWTIADPTEEDIASDVEVAEPAAEPVRKIASAVRPSVSKKPRTRK